MRLDPRLPSDELHVIEANGRVHRITNLQPEDKPVVIDGPDSVAHTFRSYRGLQRAVCDQPCGDYRDACQAHGCVRAGLADLQAPPPGRARDSWAKRLLRSLWPEGD